MTEPALRLVHTEMRCNKCGEVKPLDEFWADGRKRSRQRFGRNNICRACLTSKRKRYELLANDDPAILNGRRVCSGCGEEKSLTEFTRAAYFPVGRDLRCKKCKNAWRAARKVHKIRPPKIEPTARDYQRRYNTGVSSVAFRALFDAQDGRCGICAQPMDFLAKETCVDHNHRTGVIRGVLCQRCNLGIGHMRDDIGLMRAAIAYLEKHGEV